MPHFSEHLICLLLCNLDECLVKADAETKKKQKAKRNKDRFRQFGQGLGAFGSDRNLGEDDDNSDFFDGPMSPMGNGDMGEIEEGEAPRPKTPEAAASRPATPGSPGSPGSPGTEGKNLPKHWSEYPEGLERDNAAAARLQQIYRGHSQRTFHGMLKRVKEVDMTAKKIPKAMTLANRLERVEQQCEDLERENHQLNMAIARVKQDAADAIKAAEDMAAKAIKGLTRLDGEMGHLKDHVDESLLEASQRADGLDAAMSAFQDEVAQGFSDQGATLETLKKDVAYIQSPEGQENLKDGLIEKQMGGVLKLVREVKNVIDAAGPLPRQDTELIKKLQGCCLQAGKCLDKAQTIEEEEAAEAAASGAAVNPNAWLGALNEPDFMNDLMELLWQVHITLKDDLAAKAIAEGGGGGPDLFTLDGVTVYVESLADLLGDAGQAIAAVMEFFLNKGRQQLAIRELWGSLGSIKSDVLKDVTAAVQGAMDKKCDVDAFVGLQKRADASIKETARMKPEVAIWSENRHKLVGLDVDVFNDVAGRVDEAFTTMFAIGAKVDAKVSAADMETILGGLQAQFNDLEERHAGQSEDFEKMLEPKADRVELAKLARALASKGEKDDPILAFLTDKPKFHCMSCNRPLPKIPNSTDVERALPRPAPEVFEGRPASPGTHGGVLVPMFDKPLAKVRPPPKQRSLAPGDAHKYALDLAVAASERGGGLVGSPLPVEQGTPVSRYQRDIPSNPSRLR